MNSINTEILISEVFERKPLWDIKCGDYSKRDVVKTLWNEVADILKCDGDAVKKRWKGLRDNYRMELKKNNQKLKSGSAAGVRTIKWTHFDSLHFLRDVFESKLLEENIPSTSDEQFSTDSTNTFEYSSTLQENLTFEESESEKQTHSSNLSTFSKPIRKKKRISEDEFINLEKAKLKLLATENELKNDSDYNFLVSCMPHLKSLSQLNNLKFRNETTRLLLELKTSEVAYEFVCESPEPWDNFNDSTIL